MQILQQRIAQHVRVRSLTDDRREVFKASLLRRTPAALAHDELIVSVTELSDYYRLEKPDLGNGRGQLLQRFLIESPARLARIRRNRPDRNFLKVRTGDLAQPGVGSFIRDDGPVLTNHLH